MTKVLVIDDDVKLLSLLTEYMSQFGFEVQTASHPSEGLKKLAQFIPDVVILDVMLPDKNGFEVCKQIRGASSVPVVMLTARGELADKVLGLELGADDYLAKPFEPRELIARVETILRRSRTQPPTQVLTRGSVKIDIQKRTVALRSELLDLSTSEFDVLLLLISHPERVFSRDAIVAKLKGSDWATFERGVDVLISRLRQKLGDDAKQPRFIKTIWGAGYKYVGGEDDA